MTPTEADVRALLVGKTAEVLALDPAAVPSQASFVEELHADSLDLLEIVEGVEAQLRDRGWRARLAESELVAARTIEDVVRRLHPRLRPLAVGEQTS